jgi:hypothetical protein
MVLIRKHCPSNLCKCASYKRAAPLAHHIPLFSAGDLYIYENGVVISERSFQLPGIIPATRPTLKNGNSVSHKIFHKLKIPVL